MKVSVAVCTYNGERFLREQLDSIACQTLIPDEIVVQDDRSTDGTLEIANRFASVAPCQVTVIKNEINLGSTSNFGTAIERCQGDLIFLADQDDVWHPQKVETLVETFQQNPEAALVASDAEVVSEDLSPLGYRLWQAVGFTPKVRAEFNADRGLRLLLKKYYITGATLAFRSQYKDLILPIPTQWVHDAWISILLRAVSSVVLCDAPLIKYRQHHNQQIGASPQTLWSQARAGLQQDEAFFQKTLQMFQQARDRLQDLEASESQRWILDELEQKIEHAERRYEMRRRGRPTALVLSELLNGRYSRYSPGWKAFLMDLYVTMSMGKGTVDKSPRS